jgi:hypothetical protein
MDKQFFDVKMEKYGLFIMVTMDWSAGFWKKMEKKHNNLNWR